MNRADRFEGRDWAAAAVFFAASLALRVPFRSQFAYHWDSAEFVLAMREYNVALSQPHAPGYFLYVMLGRLVNVFVGDPHASLVWISVVAGAGLVAVMYTLGASMFGRRAGVAAALFTMTSPQTWFYSEVALTYIADSLLVCITALWCWRGISRGGTWLDSVAVGVLAAAIGGVRQQTAPMIAPLLLYSFWRFRPPRGRKLLLATVTTTVLGIAWFWPMVAMTGGLQMYLRTVRQASRFVAPMTLMGGGWYAFSWNTLFAVLFCWDGLLLAMLLIAGGLLCRVFWCDAGRKQEWDRSNGPALQFLTLWLVPMIVLGTVGVTRQPGYVLSYLPAWFLVAAVVAAQLRRRGVLIGIVTVVCIANVFVFLALPRQWNGLFYGTEHTAKEIRGHDQALERTIAVMRSEFTPAETVVCHAYEYLLFGLRHFQLYAPEFDHYQFAFDPAMLAPKERSMISAHNGRLEFVSAMDLAGKNALLLVVPPGEDVGRLKPFWSRFGISNPQPVKDSDGILYVAPLKNPRIVQMLDTER